MKRTKTIWREAVKHKGLVCLFLKKNQWLMTKSHSIGYEDYVVTGVIALFEALKTYSPKRGKWSVYAMRAIRDRILEEYKNQGFYAVRVPVYMHGKIKLDPEKDTEAVHAARMALYDKIEDEETCCDNTF